MCGRCTISVAVIFAHNILSGMHTFALCMGRGCGCKLVGVWEVGCVQCRCGYVYLHNWF